jgi:protein-S-isoprenylcysteine O-methyltransferase Ste14
VKIPVSNQASYRKGVAQLVGFSLVTATCLFGSAGTLSWWNGWAFLGVGMVVAALTVSFFRKSPELLAERMSAAGQAKAWDRVLVPLLGGVLPFLSIILGGLDHRFGWTTSVTTWESALALLVMLVGVALTLRAMQNNPFFSSHVRIQADRGHTVVSSGPYGYVRHPGYTGTILYNLPLPILLGSVVALWAAIAMLLVVVVRTALEDRTLRNELAGYRDYASRVRYRLIPFVW